METGRKCLLCKLVTARRPNQKRATDRVKIGVLMPLDCDRHLKYLCSVWTVLDHDASSTLPSFTRLSPVSQSLRDWSCFTEWAWERLLSTRFGGYGPGWHGSNATEQAAYRLELTASVRHIVLQSNHSVRALMWTVLHTSTPDKISRWGHLGRGSISQQQFGNQKVGDPTTNIITPCRSLIKSLSKTS